MPKAIDLTGHTYGRLTVVSEVLPRGRPRKWNCICVCGTEKQIDGSAMRSGATTSCGCYNREVITSHGDTGTRLFGIWQHMKRRCYNTNSHAYPNYGGIGVTVCDEWRNDFQAFKEWSLRNGYDQSLSIDRINCAMTYSPSTCRWTTQDIQSRNQRIKTNGTCEYVGVSYVAKNKTYQASTCVNNKRIYLGRYKTGEEAARVRDQYIIDNGLEGFVLNFP
jgi:hypothetical protein